MGAKVKFLPGKGYDLDGNYVGEERSAMRPQGLHADIAIIGGTGKKGSLDWIGTISQIVIYGNFEIASEVDRLVRVLDFHGII